MRARDSKTIAAALPSIHHPTDGIATIKLPYICKVPFQLLFWGGRKPGGAGGTGSLGAHTFSLGTHTCLPLEAKGGRLLALYPRGPAEPGEGAALYGHSGDPRGAGETLGVAPKKMWVHRLFGVRMHVACMHAATGRRCTSPGNYLHPALRCGWALPLYIS